MNKLKKAVKITEQCFKIAGEIIVPGITEKQIASKMRKCAKCLGADGLAYFPIVSTRSSYKKIHIRPTNRKIKENDFVLIDFGVRCGRARTDVTRTYCVKPDKKQKEIYNLLKRSQKLAEKQIRPGVSCSKVDIKVRKYLKKHSRLKFPYSLGHGVGKKIHQKPKISPKSKDIFKIGDVFTLEPGLHSDDTGARLEDMYILTRKGQKKITKNISADL